MNFFKKCFIVALINHSRFIKQAKMYLKLTFKFVSRNLFIRFFFLRMNLEDQDY